MYCVLCLLLTLDLHLCTVQLQVCEHHCRATIATEYLATCSLIPRLSVWNCVFAEILGTRLATSTCKSFVIIQEVMLLHNVCSSLQ